MDRTTQLIEEYLGNYCYYPKPATLRRRRLLRNADLGPARRQARAEIVQHRKHLAFCRRRRERYQQRRLQ